MQLTEEADADQRFLRLNDDSNHAVLIRGRGDGHGRNRGRGRSRARGHAHGDDAPRQETDLSIVPSFRDLRPSRSRLGGRRQAPP